MENLMPDLIEKKSTIVDGLHFNNLPDAVIVIDNSMNIQLWNLEAEKMYGWKEEEALGRDLEALLKAEFISEQAEDVSKHLRENGEWEGIVKHLTKDGQIVDVYARSTAIFDEDNNTTGYIAVNRDITNSGFYVNDILGIYQQMRDLSRHLQNAREEERTRISREIHDELGQILTTLKMNLYSVIESGELVSPLMSSKLGRTLKLVDSAVTTVRRIASELRIPILDHLGLMPAIEWQIKEFEANSGITCTKKLIKEVKLDNNKSTAIFRIFQELLNNITKHAAADKVEIEFNIVDNNFLMSVADNGVGFGETAKKNSFGIIGIKERVKIFNGEFKISQPTKGGTRVLILIPI